MTPFLVKVLGEIDFAQLYSFFSKLQLIRVISTNDARAKLVQILDAKLIRSQMPVFPLVSGGDAFTFHRGTYNL